jgi:hypothetical protein
MSTHQNERRHEAAQFLWLWIIRGLALAHLWVGYRGYGGSALSVGTDLLALAVLECARELAALRKTVGRRRGDWL